MSHCIYVNEGGDCTAYDCTHERCIMVPYSPTHIKVRKKELLQLKARVLELEKEIKDMEIASTVALNTQNQ